MYAYDLSGKSRNSGRIIVYRWNQPEIIKIFALLAFFVLFAQIAYMPVLFAQDRPAQPTPVILSQATSETLFDRVEALGTLRANESVDVTAQVTEIITAIKFEDGQRVKKGDVLAEMTSAEEVAQLKEAEAAIREAKEQLERAQPLAQRGFGSEATLSERRGTYETAVARLEAVKSRLSDRLIVAPFDGVVGLRRISAGALVEPGTVITNLDDGSVMKLDFTIPATYLPTIRIDAPIIATARAFSDRTFQGKVTGIDSRVDPITRSITVRAMLPNPYGLLRAGLLMTVEILKNERKAVIVPEQAVIVRGREAHVLVANPASPAPAAEKRVVTLGARNAGTVEVLSGLQAGDHVVTHGTLRLRPGQPVSVTAIEKGEEPLSQLLDKSAAAGKPNQL